jgi:hypothetical protein
MKGTQEKVESKENKCKRNHMYTYELENRTKKYNKTGMERR